MTIELCKYIYKKKIYKYPGKNFCLYIENMNIDSWDNIKAKYSEIKSKMNVTWLSSDNLKNTIIDDLYKLHKIYFGFNKFYKILYCKKMKLFDNDIDLIGNKLSTINSKSKLQIVENTTIYIISITDMINIINSCLSTHNPMFDKYLLIYPKEITNPYTNTKLSISNLIYIYDTIKKSNHSLPTLFTYFYNCGFDLKQYELEYNYEIREYLVNLYTNKLTNTELEKQIRRMIIKLNKLFTGILIDKDFPSDILISAFKPFLKIFNILKFTKNLHKFYHYKTYLVKKIYAFILKCYSFGRKIFKIKKRYILENENSRWITQKEGVFITDYVSFYKLDIEKISNKKISNKYKFDIDDYFKNIFEYDFSSDEEDDDSDDDSDDDIFINNEYIPLTRPLTPQLSPSENENMNDAIIYPIDNYSEDDNFEDDYVNIIINGHNTETTRIVHNLINSMIDEVEDISNQEESAINILSQLFIHEGTQTNPHV